MLKFSVGRTTCLVVAVFLCLSTLVAVADSVAHGPAIAAQRCEEQHIPIVKKLVAGVPALVAAPARVSASTPLIVMYHGFGPPNSPEELARALPPIPGAITVYPNLPLLGARLPDGGTEELLRRQEDDYIGLLLYPAISGAAGELPTLIESLTETYGLSKYRPIALFGFSAGGAASLLALTEADIHPSAVVVLNSPMSTVDAIESYQRQSGRVYGWTPVAREAAIRFDVVANADRIARTNQKTAVLLVQSEGDRDLSPKSLESALHALKSAYSKHSPEPDIAARILPGADHFVLEPAEPTSPETRARASAARSLVEGWIVDHVFRDTPNCR
jgi:dienelactone hydrolase